MPNIAKSIRPTKLNQWPRIFELTPSRSALCACTISAMPFPANTNADAGASPYSMAQVAHAFVPQLVVCWCGLLVPKSTVAIWLQVRRRGPSPLAERYHLFRPQLSRMSSKEEMAAATGSSESDWGLIPGGSHSWQETQAGFEGEDGWGAEELDVGEGEDGGWQH